ncbi:MAG TPA: L,D-transpeptidase [Kofleriaceae bacterium]
MQWFAGVVVAGAFAVTGIGNAVGQGETSDRKRPKEGTPLGLADLGWPLGTKSLRATTETAVKRVPTRGERYGKLAEGTRVAWKQIVASRDACRAYLEIEPRGWVCAKDLEPSELAAAPIPRVIPEKIVERALAKSFTAVDPKGARAFDTVGDIRRGERGKRLVGSTILRWTGNTVTVGGALFARTVHGYVAADLVLAQPTSRFEGVDLTKPGVTWPFAWVVPRKTAKQLDRVSVRAAPSEPASQVREIERRLIVPVLETRNGFGRIGSDEWVALADLRIAKSSNRPEGVRPDERWLDVDLDQQVLVAYDGDRPVFATLVSTGKGKSTPTSMHRIRKKLATTRIKSPPIALGTWDFKDVPFSMEFRRYYAIHSAYWHDGFGDNRSHGCVNVSPRDGRFLFEWTYPQVPMGWLQGDARSEEGTPIRLRNAKVPNPPWTEYDADPPVPTKLTEGIPLDGETPAAPPVEPAE